MEKTGSELSKSVGFTKIGLEIAIWRLLEVGANLGKIAENSLLRSIGVILAILPKFALTLNKCQITNYSPILVNPTDFESLEPVFFHSKKNFNILAIFDKVTAL